MNFKKRIKPILLLFSGVLGLSLFTSCLNAEGKNKNSRRENTTKITILQTADIHGQLDAHPELFWET